MLRGECGGDGALYLRVADLDRTDPLDASFAARPPGQRWNPADVGCLYLNVDIETARANVLRLFATMPYGPEDLDPERAPVLVDVVLPLGTAADAYTTSGLADVNLPVTYPYDSSGAVVPHTACQRLGAEVVRAGLDAVDARSATPGGIRELAWFPNAHSVGPGRIRSFGDWY